MAAEEDCARKIPGSELEMNNGKVVILRSNPVNPYPAVEKLAQTLVGSGYQVKVIGWDRSSNEKESCGQIRLPAGNVPIVRLGIPAQFDGGFRKNLFPMIRFQLQLVKWLVRNKTTYDVIHAFDLDTGLAGCLVAKLFRKHFVYQIQDFYSASHFKQESFFYKLAKKLEFLVINRADAVTICTEQRAHQIEGSHPKLLKVIHNVPNRTDPPSACEPVIPGSHRIKIAYVGVLLPHRLLPELLTCVQKDPRFELHIAGYGPLQQVVEQHSANCDRIVFYGTISHDQALFLENQCDVMTALYDADIPNHQFCAPNKLYEAMLLGKPILMCRNTGWDDVISENDIGVLIESNEQSILNGLNQLLEKRSQWPEMAQRSQKAFHANYAWPKMEEKILQIYRSL